MNSTAIPRSSSTQFTQHCHHYYHRLFLAIIHISLLNRQSLTFSLPLYIIIPVTTNSVISSSCCTD